MQIIPKKDGCPEPEQIVLAMVKVNNDLFPAIAYHDGKDWFIWDEGKDELAEMCNPGTNWQQANHGMILSWKEIPNKAGTLGRIGRLKIEVRPPKKESSKKLLKGGWLRRPTYYR